MNRKYVLYNLREAVEALNTMIRNIESDAEYCTGVFDGEMRHLYWHMNTAWNARDVSDEHAKQCNREDFNAWVQFPEDLDMTI